MHLSDDLIFVHIPRTGGSSVRFALDNGEKFEAWRFVKTKLPPGLGVHSFARDIRKVVGTSAWRKAWTCATVRNPYRRLLSLYLLCCEWGNDKNVSRLAKGVRSVEGVKRQELQADRMRAAIQADRRTAFKTWLAWCDEVGWNPWTQFWDDPRPITRFQQIEWLTDNDGKVIVEGVYRLEAIAAMGAITIHGRDLPLKVPVKNAGPQVDDWRGYFDSETIAGTRRTFAADFERLGYGVDI